MTKNRHSRRDFLKMLSSGTCGALAHRLIAPSAGIFALARPLEALAASNQVFVLLNLAGGCSYNIAPPYASEYLRRNPTVGYTPEQSIAITSDQGLHPALTGFKTIWDEGNLALINLVGYPNPNRSHDESTNIWHSANRSLTGMSEGWAARMSAQMASSFGGVSLAGAQLIGKGGSNPARVVSNLESFGEQDLFWDRSEALFLRDMRSAFQLDQRSSSNPAEEYSQESLIKLEGNIESLKAIGSIPLPVTFPNTGLGNRFKDAARLIASGNLLNVQFIYLDVGGYDTHSDERARLTSNLTEVNAAVTAFINCMKQLNRWNDVVLATMTEFCRTMENSSRGTDHGAASPLFVMGGKVVGAQKGPAPTNDDVGNREYLTARHFNFPQIFGEIVAQMGFNPNTIFPHADMAPSPYLGLF
jgi:uncharacterized protein (DUF1501 family)